MQDSDIDVVVEVMGGVNPALDLLESAVRNGKHVVTANKELLAKHGEELFKLANEKNVVILYEAAIAGGIPIIMPIKTTLAGKHLKTHKTTIKKVTPKTIQNSHWMESTSMSKDVLYAADRKSTRLNSSHRLESRMPSSA